MGLQTYFEDFNKKIKMDYDELSELAKKRDIILNKLRENKDLPSFDEFNQGSYAMFTGVEPLDKDYDIDVGLRFNVNKSDYDPLELKQKVYEILKDHTDYGAEIRKPCVTVKYKKNGEVAYHVDLVIYTYENKDDTNSQLYLARGTNKDNKEWESADPIKLKDEIMNKWEETKERDQYRRVIRYMKRWKNIKFSSNGNSEPPGIGITLLAYEKFKPQKYDWLEMKYKFDDLEALICFVKDIKGKFIPTTYSVERKEFLYKIESFLPVSPYTNVFSKLTDIQMTEFKKKVDKLSDDLEEVKKESDVIEQCNKLYKIFGDDFPVPAKENESKSQRNFVPASSASGKE
jgi:hypothetical protein